MLVFGSIGTETENRNARRGPAFFPAAARAAKPNRTGLLPARALNDGMMPGILNQNEKCFLFYPQNDFLLVNPFCFTSSFF